MKWKNPSTLQALETSEEITNNFTVPCLTIIGDCWCLCSSIYKLILC